jgi:hypothetical protein
VAPHLLSELQLRPVAILVGRQNNPPPHAGGGNPHLPSCHVPTDTRSDELVHWLHRRDPDTKVLYCTGHKDQLFQARPVLGKTEALVDKPVTVSEFRDAVSQADFLRDFVHPYHTAATTVDASPTLTTCSAASTVLSLHGSTIHATSKSTDPPRTSW